MPGNHLEKPCTVRPEHAVQNHRRLRQSGMPCRKGKFRDAAFPVFESLYEEVRSGREAARVIAAGSKADYRETLNAELKEIHDSELWQTGREVRKLRPKTEVVHG